jgi:hypothetical protein
LERNNMKKNYLRSFSFFSFHYSNSRFASSERARRWLFSVYVFLLFLPSIHQIRILYVSREIIWKKNIWGRFRFLPFVIPIHCKKAS